MRVKIQHSLAIAPARQQGLVWSLLLMLMMLGSVRPAYALFCGANVISEGASKPEVLQKCGDPTFAEQRVNYETVYVYPGGYAVPQQHGAARAFPSAPVPGWGAPPQSVSPATRQRSSSQRATAGAFIPVYPPQPVVVATLIDEWTYNFGPHSLMYRLRFADGVLRSIMTLNYGY